MFLAGIVACSSESKQEFNTHIQAPILNVKLQDSISYSDTIVYEEEVKELPMDPIAKIKANVTRINSIKNWSKVTQLKFTEETTEGGILSKYFLKSNLEKMVEKVYGEMGKSTTEYFLNDGHLIFMYNEVSMYNAPMYTDEFDAENMEVLEFRYYFDGDSLIREIAPTGDIILYNKPYFDEGTKQYLEKFNKIKSKKEKEF